jgi:hypothetical protein
VDRKRLTNVMAPMKSRLLTAKLFLWDFIKILVYVERKSKFYIICRRELTSVVAVTPEML